MTTHDNWSTPHFKGFPWNLSLHSAEFWRNLLQSNQYMGANNLNRQFWHSQHISNYLTCKEIPEKLFVMTSESTVSVILTVLSIPYLKVSCWKADSHTVSAEYPYVPLLYRCHGILHFDIPWSLGPAQDKNQLHQSLSDHWDCNFPLQ